MKGKRIAEVGDLVLLEHDTVKLPRIAIKKRNEFWDFGYGWDYDNIYKNYREIEILEKNFQETAPERITKEVKKMLGVESVTATTITLNDTGGIAPGDELIINSLATENNSMNWKEWCLWGFIIICAIIAFYRWGYVK